MKNTTKVGNKGETLACEFLTKNKYRIIERNYRDRFCEIDVIAIKKKEIAFVEVKYRSRTDFGGAVGSITPDKFNRMQTSAEYWLSTHPRFSHMQPSLDVVTIEGSGEPAIEHLKSVFL
ncbi:YraN family protein [Candidatus Saccharibacteria bacterium]|nr:YraN family protein [Candidatus Saccharibacteria bacterium]